MQIITDETKKEIKAHGSHTFPLLVSYEKITAYDSGTESIIRNTMSKKGMHCSAMQMPCMREPCIMSRIAPIFP